MVKRVATILEFNSCHKCPFKSGGNMMNAMYCRFFDPPRQIFDMNGDNCCFMLDRDIADFCPLPEDEIFNYI